MRDRAKAARRLWSDFGSYVNVRCGPGLLVMALGLANVIGCGSAPVGSSGVGGASGSGAGGAAGYGGGAGSLVQYACDGGAPTSLACGKDHCGNALAPECPAGRWVCPIIQPSSHCPNDGEAVPSGVACGAGACPPGMLCELQSGPNTWSCTPFPNSSSADAAWHEICGCL